MYFKIGQQEINKRTKNIWLGVFFSCLLSIFIAYKNFHYPEEYNDVLFWSVIGFVILANLVNVYRFRRYLDKVRHHRIEVQDEAIRFTTGDEVSSLGFNDIAALNLYRQKDNLQHIQLKLKNNRGIRLEGYDDLETLGRLIAEKIPAAHVSGNIKT